MSIVPKTTQTHGTEAVAFELIDETVEMVNHGPDSSLILRISLDFNVILPEIAPKLLMLSNDSLRLCGCDFEQEPNGLVSGIRMMF